MHKPPSSPPGTPSDSGPPAQAGQSAHPGAHPAIHPETLPDATGTWVVDTNVILVANGQHGGVAASCVQTCQTWLRALMATGRLAVDDAHAIVGEYLHKTDVHHGQGVGDEFVRWVLHEMDNPARVDQVRMAEGVLTGGGEAEGERVAVGAGEPEGPLSDPRLAHFDPSDRKFVAVAWAHPERPVIWQATDSKWLDWAAALAEHGVRVRFLCQAAVQAFHLHKFGV